jgi:yopX protein
MRNIQFRVYNKRNRTYYDLYDAKFGAKHKTKFCNFKYVGICQHNKNIYVDSSHYKLTDDADYTTLVFEQYIGIRDKNNKMIYENDIIHVVNYGDYAIIWNFLQCGFELSPIYDGQDKVRLIASGKSRYEVVSNIHDYSFKEDKITYLINRQIIKSNTIF